MGEMGGDFDDLAGAVIVFDEPLVAVELLSGRFLDSHAFRFGFFAWGWRFAAGGCALLRDEGAGA